MKDSIQAKIAALIELNNSIATTLEDSQKAYKEFSALVKASAFKDVTEELFDLIQKAQNHKQIEMLQATLAADLVKVQTRFLIVGNDESLVSPAGFHPSELVFVKTNVCIQTDKLPRNLSGCKAYDMSKIAA